MGKKVAGAQLVLIINGGRLLFQTHQFLLFFSIVYSLYLICRRSYHLRNAVLLVSSYAFYGAWSVKFLALIMLSTVVDYSLGLKIADSANERHRKNWLIFCIVLNLSLLGFFKYYNFFAGALGELFQSFGIRVEPLLLNILLPVGISFYTFESMSYVIDVYRKKIPPCRSLLEYSVFISFFPHLVAGPIIRPARFFPSLRSEPNISHNDFFEGLFRCLGGLFKKLVFADTLALFWGDEMFANPAAFSALELLIGVYCYTFVIYLDFSSYSDIAIGLSKMMGIHLPENFNYPYLARNLREFWERWHISLSTWLRDYLYIPLGGNRHGHLQKYRNVAITMLLGGLWHGASWNFIIWGALHAAFISVSHFKNDYLRKPLRSFELPSWVQVAITFHLVAFAWIFFRCETFAHSMTYLSGLSKIFQQRPTYSGPSFVIAILLLCVLAHIGHIFHLKDKASAWFVSTPLLFKIGATSAAAGLIIICEQHFKPFIYFQF